MTTETNAPGGLSATEFKAMALEAGQWLWGTVRGAFNEKASLSQIVTDAVIGMIPLVGDVTAARDLIAVSIGLADDPKKREDTWEWVLLVIFLFALVPVIGGVAKGAGRLIVSGARSAESTAKVADHIVAFMNRIGTGNAERWLRGFSFGRYQAEVLTRLDNLVYTINTVLVRVQRRFHNVLLPSLLARMEALKDGLTRVKEEAGKRVPEAIKQLDHKLREIQAYIHAGGDTTSKATAHTVASGTTTATYVDEARLVEGGRPMRSLRGGILQNKANAKTPKSYANVYRHEPGYPDLTARADGKTGEIAAIKAFGGKIVNRELREGEHLFRLFGPEGVTHAFEIKNTAPGGVWWGVGAPPKNAKQWRMECAVLDEWNRDGYLLVATVRKDAKIKACVGTNSEMYGKDIPGQYLPGGGTQAVIAFDKATVAALERLGQEVIASGKPAVWEDAHSGLRYEIRPTGWTDANGIHGYLESAHPAYVQAIKLEARELAHKDQHDTPILEGRK